MYLFQYPDGRVGVSLDLPDPDYNVVFAEDDPDEIVKLLVNMAELEPGDVVEIMIHECEGRAALR